MAAPTLTSQQRWVSSPGEDFLQLSPSNGGPVSWIDSTGTAQGNLAASTAVSWAPDILSESKPVYGTTSGSSAKGVSIANNATVTLLNVTGASGGYVSALWIGFTANDTQSIMTIVADGNTVFNDRAVLFFGAEYQANSSSFIARYIGASNNDGVNVGFLSYIPIPFTSSISITFTNKAGFGTFIYYNILYQAGVSNTWPRTQKLVCRSGTVAAATPNQVVTLVNDSSLNPGRMLGMAFSIDSVPGSANPVTGPLEGEFKFYFDGAGSPNFFSSGTEDYIGMSNYFQGFDTTAPPAPSVNNNSVKGSIAPYAGLTLKGSGTWNAYRFHIMDPVVFQSALKVTWDAGETAFINWTGTVRFAYCLWYYTT